MVRCRGVTASGKTCRRKASYGEYCFQHRPPPADDLPPETTCDICFDSVPDDQGVTLWCCRKHTLFHRRCIERWLEVQDTCPYCRRPHPSVVREGAICPPGMAALGCVALWCWWHGIV